MHFTDACLKKVLNASLGADGLIRGEGGDPQLRYFWPALFEPGWYKFSLDLDGHPGGLPRIYFNMGFGYNELETVTLFPRRSGERFSGLIRLPRRPLEVRLDPTDTDNSFAIRRFSARRIPLPAVLARGAVRVTRTAVSKPSHISAMLARARVLLWSEQVASVGSGPVEDDEDPYAAWRERYDFVLRRDRETYLRSLDRLEVAPRISVIMPVYNTDPRHLREAISSVKDQLYGDWELCIADDASTDARIRDLVRAAASGNRRIKTAFRETNGHISAASNSALELATGDWLVPLDHDDVLRPHALAELAMWINAHRDAQIFYSDEDKIDDDGHRFDPHFKPDFSPELLRSMNYFNHMTAFRTEAVRAVGGWREGFEGAQDYDLILRLLDHLQGRGVYHIPKVLYHWRATSGSTAQSTDQKDYAWMAGARALQDHLDRSSPVPAKIRRAEDLPFYRACFDIPDPKPAVSIIIPTRDRAELLRGAVESVLELTEYPNYEIIVVDNGSVEPEAVAYLDHLERNVANARLLRWPQPFNFSAINNYAVSQSGAQMVLLMNNDVEVLTPRWLTEMVAFAQQTRIGCVGAKLLYPDRTVQHAGVIAGIGGVAGHSHKYFEEGALGYFSRLKVAQNVSAVTGACLLVRREIFLEVGGLDEERLKVAFNDVDFCFRVMKAGYLNVFIPWAQLIHHESKSRGAEDTPEKRTRFESEIRQMQRMWPDLIAHDPFYNPNLSREFEDFRLRR
jgi:O-antigen biosynthesis protein